MGRSWSPGCLSSPASCAPVLRTCSCCWSKRYSTGLGFGGAKQNLLPTQLDKLTAFLCFISALALPGLWAYFLGLVGGSTVSRDRRKKHLCRSLLLELFYFPSLCNFFFPLKNRGFLFFFFFLLVVLSRYRKFKQKGFFLAFPAKIVILCFYFGTLLHKIVYSLMDSLRCPALSYLSFSHLISNSSSVVPFPGPLVVRQFAFPVDPLGMK